MERTYWHKQAQGAPLYPDVLWSRPENKRAAGKLLIIGGNLHGFAAPAEAYQAARAAGIGSCRALLPVSLKSIAGKLLETVDFAPATPSGSFSREALAGFLENAQWADGVLLAGDFGRNSETAVAIESFLAKYHGHITVVKDGVDYAISVPQSTLERPETLLVLTMAQLQKLFQSARATEPITLGMDLLQLIDALHMFTQKHKTCLMTKHLNQLIVACNGEVSTTRTTDGPENMWRTKTAAGAAVWQLQNPARAFEALTTSVVIYD